MLLASAQAACSDPVGLLPNIESDAVSQYLSDAQKGLEEVVEALACSGPIAAEVHRRYFQVQGVIWSYGSSDDEIVQRVFATSRLREDVWNPAFGEGLEFELWTAAGPVDADPVPLEIRGLSKDEQVWVDGVLNELPIWVQPGPHLLQAGTVDQMRVARVVDVDGPATVGFPRRRAVLPPVVIEPRVVLPEPLPAPVAAPTLVPDVVPSSPKEPTGPSLIVVADATVELPLPSIEGGTLCARNAGDRKCRPFEGIGWRLDARAGLAPVEVEWSRDGERTRFVFLFWVDGSAPRRGQATVVARPNGLEVVPQGFVDPESWITEYVVSKDADCSSPLVSSTDGPLVVSWADFEPRDRRFLCALNAAGVVSDPLRLRYPRDLRGRDTTLSTQPGIEFAERSLMADPPVSTGQVCSAIKPGCEPDTDASLRRVWQHPSREEGLLPVYSTIDIDGQRETTVRYYLLDRGAPRDGQVEQVDLGTAVVLSFHGFEDLVSGVAGYRVALSDRAPPARCGGSSHVDPVEPWALLQNTPDVSWVRVCAVDAAGMRSKGVVVRLR